jgi:NADH-quinone oxidoreductase subunit J
VSTHWVASLLFWVFGVGSLIAAVQVFRVDSMVRAAFWLLASFACVGVILILLGLQFLGFILILMMAGEMAIMALFMVMFMMNPAGLNPMFMVHQHRLSLSAGVIAAIGLGAVGIAGAFPTRLLGTSADFTAQLGRELLGNSMLVFQTAGVALLATMIGAIAIAGSRGRFGSALDGSVEPVLAPASPAEPSTESPEDDEHSGHGGLS